MHIGLCEGRHEIKQNNGEALDGFIFSQVDSPMDFLSHFHTAMDFFEKGGEYTLYVTGLTTLLTATLLGRKRQGSNPSPLCTTTGKAESIFRKMYHPCFERAEGIDSQENKEGI